MPHHQLKVLPGCGYYGVLWYWYDYQFHNDIPQDHNSTGLVVRKNKKLEKCQDDMKKYGSVLFSFEKAI